MRRERLTRVGFAFLVALAFTAPAAAHGTVEGLSGFYAGFAHPFVAWEHLLLLIALGLMLGRFAGRPARWPLIALATSFVLGLALTRAGVAASPPPLVAPVLAEAALAGAALALGFAPPRAALVVACAAAGAMIALDTDLAVGDGSLLSAAEASAGLAIGVFVILLDTMAVGAFAARPSLRIAPRVAGSWIVAVAVMVLALHFRGLPGQ